MYFSEKIIHWYETNKRDLPWRNTIDPYPIWLSEIMLQQTRVAQGLPYFQKFIEKFPTIHHLAKADEEEVLKLWQGLGYSSRARNLHATAKKVSNELNGTFPNNHKDLQSLKGVGKYTAAAIASFCFNEAVAVVDGNVYRVIARFLGIDTPINSTEGEKLFAEKANLLLDKNNSAIYNQAIMEFGALQCTPNQPNCESCPLQKKCVAFQQGKQNSLPVKLKKTKVKLKHFNYLIIANQKNEVVLQKRTGSGIWQHLYEFPLLETDKKQSKDEVSKFFGEVFTLKLWNKKAVTHLLSHRKIQAYFWIAYVDEFPEIILKNESILVKKKQIHDLPVPVLLQKFIQQYFE